MNLQVGNYLAIVGNHPKLSLAELMSVYSREQQEILESDMMNNIVLLPQASLPLIDLQEKLGGTVKIQSIVSNQHDVQAIIDDIDQAQPKRIAISSFHIPQRDLQYLANQIKNSIPKIRYRILKSPLESAGIPDRFTEYSFHQSGKQEYMCKTVTAQDLRAWTKRDRYRPSVNPRSGMMPTKIARMLVNIGLSSHVDHIPTIYDPMCGSGTILTEGLSLGMNVIGSDMKAGAVAESTQNCQWLHDVYQPVGSWKVFEADASHVNQSHVGAPLDAIIFEGYLGPPNMKAADIPNMHKGLKKMYTGILKNLSKLVEGSTRLVCALPEFESTNGVKNFDSLIDSCEKYGYTRRAKVDVYGRPNAFVKRSIYILAKS